MRTAEIKQRGAPTSAIDCRQPFTIVFEYENRKVLADSRFFVVIRNARGEVVFSTSDYDLLTEQAANRRAGNFLSTIEIPAGLLKSGGYYGTIGADIKNERIIFAENDVFHFEVFESGDDTLAERHKRVGLVAPLLRWQISEANPKTQN